MKLELTFEEILAFFSKKVSQPIALAYVAPDTIAVQTTVKIKIIQKTVAIYLKLIKIDGANVYMSYSGGLGVDLVLSLLLHLMDGNEKYGALYEQLPNNELIIHLDKIPELQPVLSKITIQSVRFTEISAIANVSL